MRSCLSIDLVVEMNVKVEVCVFLPSWQMKSVF